MKHEIPVFPPHDWADPPSGAECNEWVDDAGPMHVSAMAVVALLCLALGIGMGYLLWGMS